MTVSVDCPVCAQLAGDTCRERVEGLLRTVEFHDQRCQVAGVDSGELKPAPAPRRSKPKAAPRKSATANQPKTTPNAPTWYLGEPSAPPAPDVVLHADRTAPVTVVVLPRALEHLKHFSTIRGLHTEEGGRCMGLTPRIGEVLITDIGGPGPASERNGRSYRPDGAHDEAFVRQLLADSGGAIYELADWHLQPGGSDQPSATDLQAWASWLTHIQAAETPYRYRPGWISLIVYPDRKARALKIAPWLTRSAGSVRGREWFTCDRCRLETK
jgi:integrative and conjugative element protein (TIGR02256 family)